MTGERSVYDKLQEELLQAKALFADPKFPPQNQSLTKNGSVPGAPYVGKIVWKRASEIFSNPEFVVRRANRHDLDQGLLGNCWFIAAAASLATAHRNQFEKVVPLDQGFEPERYTGMFHFNFWWYGKWVGIIIDDYLPTDGHRLIYCSNRERANEFWPCLLEKAYAKLRGCYENLDGGKIQDAMVDLTGGVSEVINIKDVSQVSPDLYNLLYKSYQMKTMMGACIFRPENSRTQEVEMSNGLFMGHAYSITGFKQIQMQGRTVLLIRLRNPWGKSEWNGAWSDNSTEMAYLSQSLQDELRFRNRNEGEFWMCYEDFLHNFHEIQLCHLQPDAFITELEDNERRGDWNVRVYHDQWLNGVTAGGCGNPPNGHLYWKNPQFFITLREPDNLLGHGKDCTLIVSLMEKETSNINKIAVGFDIYKLKSPELKPLDDSRAPRNALLLTRRSGNYEFYREVTKRFELQPGTYVIIPSTFHPHQEALFLLRIFTEKNVDSGVLDEKTNPKRELTPKIDELENMFLKHCGKDKKIDAVELSHFLKDMFATELKLEFQLPVEACRSLVSMMDENKSGYLSFSETKRAWKEVKAYRLIFKQFDKDSSNSVDYYELGEMFEKLGFPISRQVLSAIVRRFGDRHQRISLEDFVLIICKLTSMFALFHNQQKRYGVEDDGAVFSRNEFLATTMYI